MVFCKLSLPWDRYLEFFDKEGAVSPTLHRIDLSFEGHIPSLILVPYDNVLPCLVIGYGAQKICVGELVHDMLLIFVKCLHCDWQSEPMICDDVLVSSFFAFIPVKCT